MLAVPVLAQTAAPAPGLVALALADAPSAPAQAAGAGPMLPPADEGPEIVVWGVRASLLRSIETNRDASTILDAISAAELRQLPDRNVAEALGNIPGVTVGRDQGGGVSRDVGDHRLRRDPAGPSLCRGIEPARLGDQALQHLQQRPGLLRIFGPLAVLRHPRAAVTVRLES
ncbi:TonB-dependent receptor plug domain-containing protein [Sphingosinicellaceae bacterium]|nr:TonB-dependent receptor plug domain-containing protein [Sphingosinicellaceae bacterium]